MEEDKIYPPIIMVLMRDNRILEGAIVRPAQIDSFIALGFTPVPGAIQYGTTELRERLS